MSQTETPAPPATSRLGKLDVLRGIALIAMATYHTGWDFEFFGYMEPGTTGHGAWKLYARIIASTFLVLVGFSLVLAHRNGIRWRSFGIRLVQIIAASLAITLVTRTITPDSFVFFGILHEIAAASVLGLLFLRLPAIVIAAAAAAVIAAPHYLASAAFDAPALWPLGLSEMPIRSNDYVPIFPWFGPVLAGMALAKTMLHLDLMRIFAGTIRPAWLDRGLRFIGQHSLAFYLIHQPVLISCVFLIAQVFPPATLTPHEVFDRECTRSCSADNDRAFCERFCTCTVGQLETQKIFDDVYTGKRNQDNDPQLQDITGMCTQEAMQP
ncbi:heparan-alpha-glucosaminide N-acetyltransferase [Phyllobacterium sp. 22229]|uniref:heparan-alpha-glucosaminide N-acetyltransferase n=1 Tax=Phyllobacterium sp. 22229 TaxID=3453895 RepID=UPI003F86CB33